jgi:hypothetical protein
MITPLRHTPLLPGTLQNLFYPPREYVYFERAGEVPFAGAGALTKAAWAADAAMLAYARYGENRMADADLDANFGRAGLAYKKIGGTLADWTRQGRKPSSPTALTSHYAPFAAQRKMIQTILYRTLIFCLCTNQTIAQCRKIRDCPLGICHSSVTYSPSHVLCTAVFS